MGFLLSSKAINIPDVAFKKFKARLVAKGDMLKNIRYPSTLSCTLRLLISLAAEHYLDLVFHDIKTVFLY